MTTLIDLLNTLRHDALTNLLPFKELLPKERQDAYDNTLRELFSPIANFVTPCADCGEPLEVGNHIHRNVILSGPVYAGPEGIK